MLSPRKFHHLFHRRDSTFLQRNVGLSEATRGTHGRRLMSEIEPILNPPAPPAGRPVHILLQLYTSSTCGSVYSWKPARMGR